MPGLRELAKMAWPTIGRWLPGFEVWLRGLVAASIAGASNSVMLMIADPKDFNLADGLGRVESAAIAGALIGVVAYLKQSPLPKGGGNDAES
jgi:hypothetical protein